MTDVWVVPDLLFDGQSLTSGQAIRIVDNEVVDIAHEHEGGLRFKGCISPGFVDLQVNGGGGAMLNSTPTREGIATIAQAHRRFGTVAVMPTVITDAPDVLDRAVEAAIVSQHGEGIVGLHIEGPHISVERRGTHNRDFIRDLDARTMDVVAKLRKHDLAVIITLAPEAASTDQIAALSDMGATVSIGHTNANAELVEAAIAAGASCATHLFNAMSPMAGRAPGAVGAIINSRVRSGIICDGYHVDDRMVALAIQARPARDLMFLVSDAMATVGGPDHFDLYGQDVRLDQGRLINVEGNLAGAHITQAQGVARLVNQVGISPETALRMAISTPAEIVGQSDLASLIGQNIRNLISMTDDFSQTEAFVDAFALAVANDAAE
ncbi:N-acetylglucosamine-6-phosphate deacetylase [Octadecabacter ascidiaceicola]|uniref:N-acetylglucosamine-6-phosphate deacetylase n=1 Tax=Octadecabacter ascidiaceicola TaxID=1655543 RepID=A0A238KPN5_9RHOB|nr:N-acetylglucosamine-6-phosphate deacetylase [Octadecabacter ascidiaceicola]SMX44755.1 N-acetylglucosamine-6-phosphate deacetylase [Octadecabacter ascidiaceicola]